MTTAVTRARVSERTSRTVRSRQRSGPRTALEGAPTTVTSVRPPDDGARDYACGARRPKELIARARGDGVRRPCRRGGAVPPSCPCPTRDRRAVAPCGYCWPRL